MPQQIINNGTFDNDPSAEKIRTAFDKVNDNFTEVYAMGGGGGGAVDDVDGLTGSLTTGQIVNSLTEKTTIVDDDLIGGADSEATNISKKWKFSTISTYILSKLGAYLFSLTAKTTPIDADTITINDSEDSNLLKKLSFTNLKAFLSSTPQYTQYQQTLPSRLTTSTNINTWRGWNGLNNMFMGDTNASFGTGTNPTFAPASDAVGFYIKNINSLNAFNLRWWGSGTWEMQVQVWLYDIDNTETIAGNRYKNGRKVVDETYVISTSSTTSQKDFTITSHTLTAESAFYLFYRFKSDTITPIGFLSHPVFTWLFKNS